MLHQESGSGKLIRQETCFKLKLVKHLEKTKGFKKLSYTVLSEK